MSKIDPNGEWSEIMGHTTKLPGTWAPRREQSEWDRMFSGRAEIQSAFTAGTDKARTWALEALAFSDTLQGGFESLTAVRQFGLDAKQHIAKGKNQFDN